MTIAVAHNDSPEGQAALVHAAREAEFQGSGLAVLRVLDRESAANEEQLETLRADIRLRLESAGLESVPWTLHTASDDEGRAAALVKLADDVAADLLVVGSRRRTPIGKFLLGSTVQRVVLDSPVPVLVVKARPPDGP